MSVQRKRKAAKSLGGLFNEAALQELGAQPETMNDHLNRYFRSMQMASSSTPSTPMTQRARKKVQKQKVNKTSSFETRKDSFTFTQPTESGDTEQVRLVQPAPLQQDDDIKQTDASMVAQDNQGQMTKRRKRPTARKTIKKSARSIEQINKLQKMEKDKSNDNQRHKETMAETQDSEQKEGTSRVNIPDQLLLEENSAQDSFSQLKQNVPSQNVKTKGTTGTITLLQSLQNDGVEPDKLHSLPNVKETLENDSSPPSPAARDESALHEANTGHAPDSTVHIKTGSKNPKVTGDKVIPRRTKAKGKLQQQKLKDLRSSHATEKQLSKSLSPKLPSGPETEVSTKRRKKANSKTSDTLRKMTKAPENENGSNVPDSAVRSTSPTSFTRITPGLRKGVKMHKVTQERTRTGQSDHLRFVKRQLGIAQETLLFAGNFRGSFDTNMAGKKSQVKESVVENVIKKYNKLLLRHGHGNSEKVDDLSVNAVNLIRENTNVQFHDKYWKRASRDMNFTFPDEVPEVHAVNKTQFRRYEQLTKNIAGTRRRREQIFSHLKLLIVLLYDLDALKKVGDKLREETPSSRVEASLRAKKFRSAVNDAKRVLQFLNEKKET